MACYKDVTRHSEDIMLNIHSSGVIMLAKEKLLLSMLINVYSFAVHEALQDLFVVFLLVFHAFAAVC